MSLLMEVLNRLKEGKKKVSVHPFFLKSNASKANRRNKLLISGIALMGVAGAVAGYFVVNMLSMGKSKFADIPPATLAKRPPPTTEVVPEAPPPGVHKEKKKPAPKNATSSSKGEMKSSKASTEKVPSEEEFIANRKLPPPPPAPGSVPTSEKSLAFQDLVLEADKLFRKGRLSESIKLYEKALSMKQDKVVINNLLSLYIRTGKLSKAKDLINKYRDSELIYTYMLEMANVGHTEEAIEFGKRVVDSDKDGFVSLALGNLYERNKDLERALEFYEKAYRTNPNNGYFAFNYARLLEAQGEVKRAYEIYKKLYTMEVENPIIRNMVRERVRFLESALGG